MLLPSWRSSLTYVAIFGTCNPLLCGKPGRLGRLVSDWPRESGWHFVLIEEDLRKRSCMYKGVRRMYNVAARAGPWGRSCCGDLSPFSSHFRGLETVGGDAAS